MTTQQHLATGAYALGVMEPADAWHFEAHLDECAACVAQLREFARLESLLAGLAATWPPGETWVPEPSPGLFDRMTREVTAVRRAGRKRRTYLLAAAAALVLGSSVVAGLGRSGAAPGAPTSAKEQVLALDEKVRHTDPGSGVAAMVGMEKRDWGTDVGLEVKNVRGPLTCRLLAVGRNGDEQTVATWSVPPSGYGVPGTASQNEFLWAQGAAAMDRADIERFEVRTLDGTRLVAVKAQPGAP
ncbi:zf-HC2 domain-containing protein [Streptomyces sp. 8N616]|uniref:zf-HC2 domain-containing protein n=1 Tax=Streptomyces sp. 8N616 TaxID=3457414 RepID=UPI003FD06040